MSSQAAQEEEEEAEGAADAGGLSGISKLAVLDKASSTVVPASLATRSPEVPATPLSGEALRALERLEASHSSGFGGLLRDLKRKRKKKGRGATQADDEAATAALMSQQPLTWLAVQGARDQAMKALQLARLRRDVDEHVEELRLPLDHYLVVVEEVAAWHTTAQLLEEWNMHDLAAHVRHTAAQLTSINAELGPLQPIN